MNVAVSHRKLCLFSLRWLYAEAESLMNLPTGTDIIQKPNW